MGGGTATLPSSCRQFHPQWCRAALPPRASDWHFNAATFPRVEFMFTLLRSVVIVGLIFYFSPTRENGYLQQKPSGEGRRPAPADAPRPSASLEIQDGALNRFVGSLKEEVVREIGRASCRER